MNTDSISYTMNGPRPIESIKNLSSQQMKEQIGQLKSQNDKLFEENLKLNRNIHQLEDAQHKLIAQTPLMNSNNTSANFFMISQIGDIWETIARENINDCFIDFITKPELLYDLIQEMVIIIQSMIKEEINGIIQSFIKQWNLLLTYQENNYKLISGGIRAIIKEFYYDIFESECKRNEDNYAKFKEKYLRYFNKNVIGLISNDLRKQFMEDFHSVYFYKMYLNIQKIMFFIEFKENIYIDLPRKENRTIESITLKNNDCLSVEGLLNESNNLIILLDAPKTKSGFYAYKQLKPIVVSYSKRANSSENLRLQSCNDLQEKLINNFSVNSIHNDINKCSIITQGNVDPSPVDTYFNKTHRLNPSQKITKDVYVKLSNLLYQSKTKGAHSKTPSKINKGVLSPHSNSQNKFKNTMTITNHLRKKKKQYTSANTQSHSQSQSQSQYKNQCCPTESEDLISNSLLNKYKESISMKLKKQFKSFTYNVNTINQIQMKASSMTKQNNNLATTTSNSRHYHYHNNSNNHLHNDHESKSFEKKKNEYISSTQSLILQQILSPLRTKKPFLSKGFKFKPINTHCNIDN